eukprot:GILI01019447.1.p1 GENE.GILI01019447.1~~GILI01019447.1.p1  ORF type:complete len:448 (-),score=66.23 GILI01019447.1:36-1337(-)
MAFHLVIVAHGLWGTPKDVSFLANQIQKHAGSEFLVHVSLVNSGIKTYDGIDVCGERLFQEILQLLEKNPSITRISLIGYSAGGLFSRYAIGRLQKTGVFDRIEPVNFMTFATPHLGIRRTPRSLWNRVWQAGASFFVARAGEHMALEDGQNPLLLKMTAPGSHFMVGLSRFKYRVAYANTANDNTVPYCTASLSSKNPYRAGARSYRFSKRLKKYPHIVNIHYLNDHASHHHTHSSHPHSPASPDLNLNHDDTQPILTTVPASSSSSEAVTVATPEAISTTFQDEWTEVDEDDSRSSGHSVKEALRGALTLTVFVTFSPIIFLALGTSAVVAKVNSSKLNIPTDHEEEEEGAKLDIAAGAEQEDDTHFFRNDQKGHVIRSMFRNLRKLSWKIVDVQLPGGHTHGRIIVRRPTFDKAGCDVIDHCVHLLQMHK